MRGWAISEVLGSRQVYLFASSTAASPEYIKGDVRHQPFTGWQLHAGGTIFARKPGIFSICESAPSLPPATTPSVRPHTLAPTLAPSSEPTSAPVVTPTSQTIKSRHEPDNTTQDFCTFSLTIAESAGSDSDVDLLEPVALKILRSAVGKYSLVQIGSSGMPVYGRKAEQPAKQQEPLFLYYMYRYVHKGWAKNKESGAWCIGGKAGSRHILMFAETKTQRPMSSAVWEIFSASGFTKRLSKLVSFSRECAHNKPAKKNVTSSTTKTANQRRVNLCGTYTETV